MQSIPGYRFDRALHADDDYVLFRGVRESDSAGALIKLLRRADAEPRDAALLRHEFGLVRSVESPLVLRAVDVRRSGAGIALIFEDFESESLRARVQRERLDLQSVLELGIQAATALSAIHQAGVVHKRMTPASILVGASAASIRVTDFSAASRLRRERERSGGAIEAAWLPYVSPEQTGRMNRSVDYRTDLYSLGVTLYEMLTGHLPFAADDVMGLVHCHIARRPSPPHDVAPEIPRAVSDVVMRLLAKRAEDRYQSGLGVAADLKTCLSAWSSSGAVPEFDVGAMDVSPRLEIPEKLYGRGDELERLITAFDRAAQGAAEFYVVAGEAGVGKSALVREVHRPIVARRGYFISGKFDQFQRDVPYSALTEAFSDMIRQILAESDDRVAWWRDRFRSVLGDGVAVIAEMIPEFELVVGTAEPLAPVSPTEEQTRFNLAFQRFVQACASPEQPLVVFLDDLQWADLATLQLIQRVGADREMRHILQIGAYRDNEVELHHPLVLTIAALHKSAAHVEEETLGPLAPAHLLELVADSLRAGCEDVQALADLVHEKTDGNPFFVRQFLESLYERGLLELDTGSGRWAWSLDRIRTEDATSNVVDLMVRKIQELPAATQDALRLASCIGNQFDLETLSLVRQTPREQTAVDLWGAVREGLVLPVGQTYRLLHEATDEQQQASASLDDVHVSYRFLHDRVQQAAYALISTEERGDLHMRIGRLLVAGLEPEELDERVFDIVNHLNVGIDRIEDAPERLHVARLNLAAGTKAMTSSAYDPAARYLAMGISLLPHDAWEAQYQLAHTLHEKACIAESMRLHVARMEELAAVILEHAVDPLDMVGVYKLRIRYLSTQGRMLEACHASIDILERLGVTIPKQPSKLTVTRTFFTTRLRLSRTTPDALRDAPLMTDPVALAAIEVCAQSGPPAYQGAPDLLPLFICKEVDLSLRYGNAPPSSHGYGAWAVLLAAAVNDGQGAYTYGQLGEDVARRFDDKGTLGRAIFMFNCFSRHWVDAQAACYEPVVRARELLVEGGDLEYFAYSVYHPSYFALFAGERLQVVSERFERGVETLVRLDMEQALPMARIGLQATLDLRGLSESATSLACADYDPYAHVPEYIENGHRAAVHYVHLLTAMLNYVFGDHDAAVRSAEEATQFVDGVAAMIVVVELNLYQSLAVLAQARGGDGGTRRAAIRIARRNQKVMAQWAKNAPGNFRHKLDLVDAEIQSLLGHHTDAVTAYDRAIAGAREQRFVHEEAIACERAALHYIAAGRTTVCAAYMREAADAYAQWGATGKLHALRTEHPDLLPTTGLQRSPHEPAPDGVSGDAVLGELDLASVLKASRAISSEIVLERLQGTLLALVIENAGAERGLLVRVSEGSSVVEAEATADDSYSTACSAVDDGDRLSAAIVHYVIRTKKALVIEDAAQDSRFTPDIYVRDRTPRSVLAVPLLHQGAVTGLVYLENNLTSGAFTSDRVEVIRMLASQASISLQNARLYGGMAELNRAYERFVPRQFLRSLAKASIVDVGLGDHVERDLTVLFADIRSFTTLSESMSPEDNFRFLNSYLGRMEPIVIRHGGFIDKYMGDSIMALFEGSADAAVRAAVDMVRALDEHNEVRVRRGDAAIHVGIGINSGPVMLGTIGGHDRMDGTVIGDTINAADRIEGLTKHYGSSILVSQNTVERLADAAAYQIRCLGRARVQGRSRWTTVHEVYSCDRPELIAAKDATRDLLAESLRLFHERDLGGATSCLGRALESLPDDPAIKFLRLRVEDAALRDLPPDWDGAVTFHTK